MIGAGAGAHRLVVVGGGFGGLNLARALAPGVAQVSLLDRRNFHLFQPLLYQVATGALSPANIAAPLRAVLKRRRDVSVLLAEATGVDPAARRVLLADGGSLAYDSLVLAAGARHHYFDHPEWERLAPGLKTIEDATEIRRRVLGAFEAAEREGDPRAREAWLSFVVVGAGATGVELAGALAEIARHTLRGNFRRIDPATARIRLLEGGERVLAGYPPDLSAKAQRSLERLGVEVLTRSLVTGLTPEAVALRRDGRDEALPARTVLWAAGVQASPVAAALARDAGAAVDRAGRLIVEPDLSLPGRPEILALGDMAHCRDASGRPLPGVAPVAMQQGRYAARLLAARLRGERLAPFRYRDKGSMATIGRAAAVADLGFVRFGGYPAWLAWLFVHLMYLVEYDDRLLVLVQWAWSYATRNRSARLITQPGWPAR